MISTAVLPSARPAAARGTVQALPLRRILVVDDHAESAEVLARTLAAFGAEVGVATDALHALDLAPTFHPEVVLLDLVMPGLDGYWTARRFRGAPKLESIPLIAVSGWNQGDDAVRRVREAGFQFFLTKPVDVAELWTCLRAIAELRDGGGDAVLDPEPPARP